MKLKDALNEGNTIQLPTYKEIDKLIENWQEVMALVDKSAKRK